MKQRAKASSAGSTQRQALRLGQFVRGAFGRREARPRFGGSSALSNSSSDTGARVAVRPLAVIAILAYGVLAVVLGTAPASAACPNVVFRTGPSAKLPDCRAYELVTPTYTGGVPPTATDFLSVDQYFEFPLMTRSGNSLMFQTLAGALTGFPGTGFNDRFRSRRTSSGWVTEFVGASGGESDHPVYGGASADHDYYAMASGSGGYETVGTLTELFGTRLGRAMFLHKPDGSFEPIAKGSLGQYPLADTHLITPGASHIIFSTDSEQLEPEAPATGTVIYDRAPGGPTHVVSLLPGNVPPSNSARLLAASPDGRQVIFQVDNPNGIGALYARIDNTVTKEIVRSEGVAVNRKLSCSGNPSDATLSYQWLRDGGAIPAATSPDYTTSQDDAGTTVQCRVTAEKAEEGTTVAVSSARLVEPYLGTSPSVPGSVFVAGGVGNTATVGELLTCETSGWQNSPTFGYRWLRNGVAIAGATSSTYTTVASDKGVKIQCDAKGANADGAATAVSSGTLIVGEPPKATANPQISNVSDPGNPPAVGDELSCSQGTWTNSPAFAYRWLRDGTAIGGATASAYSAVGADEGKGLQCIATATNADASTEAISDRVLVDPQSATAPPQLTSVGMVWGTGAVGETLFCETGSWSGDEPSFAYQWLRNGAEIGGATTASYTLVGADRQKTVQCRIKATDVNGSAVAVNADSGAIYVNPNPPFSNAQFPETGKTFAGIFGGNVFYSDVPSGFEQAPGDLFSVDLATDAPTRITTTGDAKWVNVSDDGSHVYFLSPSQINGEGEAGEPNLYVWSRAGESTKFIATVRSEDLSPPFDNHHAALASWPSAVRESSEVGGGGGRGESHTRSTPDGSVFVFESTAKLTAFDNTEANEDACATPSKERTEEEIEEGFEEDLEPCLEVYRYDTESEELTCVSCGPGEGPATGEARLQTLNTVTIQSGVVYPQNPATNVTNDGNTVVFESYEGLVPQDGNEARDVYRWQQGSGAALISTGQQLTDAKLYSMTPDGSDIAFYIGQQLLPQDENGSTLRIYDARVNGGFPPPEDTVTEPCAGDICQGAASRAPETPATATSSLSGAGNVATLRCRKGQRRASHNGKERCLNRHHRRKRKAHKKRQKPNAVARQGVSK